MGQRCEGWNKGEEAGLFWYYQLLSQSCLRIAAPTRNGPPHPLQLSFGSLSADWHLCSQRDNFLPCGDGMGAVVAVDLQ